MIAFDRILIELYFLLELIIILLILSIQEVLRL